MHELMGKASGERLDRADYLADFDRYFWQIGSAGFWKLERQQFFQEPGNASWMAFAEGDWQDSLRLLEADRAPQRAYFLRIEDHGIPFQRVRVVEEPLTPYLQWELHALRLREQCGAGVRVVGPEQVERFESAGPLPEINVLGTAVMYEILYDERGILAGGVKYTDPELVQRWQRLIADLYDEGEPLADYFDRAVAGLPAPSGPRTM